MKKLWSLCVITSILLLYVYSLVSCGGGEPPTEPEEPATDGELATVIVPPYRDYGRGTLDFDKLEYERPDIEAISSEILAVAERIEGGELSFEDVTSLIESVEDGYTLVFTMYTLAELGNMRDSSDPFWHAEYEYTSVSYAYFADALEAMLVACAESEHRERLENEYFGYSLEEYADGEKYTDRSVELMAREAELEAEYSAISTATVEITYLGTSGTVDTVLESLRASYGAESAIYASAYGDCMKLYYEESDRIGSEIFLELLSLRALIADELGYGSYTEYAYEVMGHGYEVRDMKRFLYSVKDSVYPVFSKLYTRVFKGYFHNLEPAPLEAAVSLNTLFELYEKTDAGLSLAYSYMLQHKLYDIDTASAGRFDGSFTTYIEGNNSPYLFVTREGVLTDYLTLAHEFGHFYDGYMNYGMNTSLDLSEISSQGLELLTVAHLKEELSEGEHRFLEYYEMYSLLNVLLIQSFYSAFEHFVYELEYDEINRENVDAAVTRASEFIFGAPVYEDLTAVLIPHTVLYPHYVQSYCTSAVSALEIYFLECADTGAGVDVYLELVSGGGELFADYSLTLESVGLTSPFADGSLASICDKIHYRILGSRYFKEQSGGAGDA